MLAEKREPSHEYYVAILNDRSLNGPALVASAQGGMNIEEVAAKDPAAIHTFPIDFQHGLSKEKGVEIAKTLGIKDHQAAAEIFINLYRLFKDKDATQIEINPLAETKDGAVLWYVRLPDYAP
jgi:succinyl-CoA synthetase beta subunit